MQDIETSLEAEFFIYKRWTEKEVLNYWTLRQITRSMQVVIPWLQTPSPVHLTPSWAKSQ
jgi:hypothetical protein